MLWLCYVNLLTPRRYVTAALRVTLRDMTETYVAVAWDRAVPHDHASRTFQNVFAELVL